MATVGIKGLSYSVILYGSNPLALTVVI